MKKMLYLCQDDVILPIFLDVVALIACLEVKFLQFSMVLAVGQVEQNVSIAAVGYITSRAALEYMMLVVVTTSSTLQFSFLSASIIQRKI